MIFCISGLDRRRKVLRQGARLPVQLPRRQRPRRLEVVQSHLALDPLRRLAGGDLVLAVAPLLCTLRRHLRENTIDKCENTRSIFSVPTVNCSYVARYGSF